MQEIFVRVFMNFSIENESRNFVDGVYVEFVGQLENTESVTFGCYSKVSQMKRKLMFLQHQSVARCYLKAFHGAIV